MGFSVEVQVGLTCDYDFVFLQTLLLQRKMGQKGRRVTKIEVPTDSPTEFELVDMADINSGGGRRGRQEKGRKRHRNRGRKSGGKNLHNQQRREWQKSMQGQIEVTQKWIQRLEERWTHPTHTKGTRRGT